jgi:hypothetical protein
MGKSLRTGRSLKGEGEAEGQPQSSQAGSSNSMMGCANSSFLGTSLRELIHKFRHRTLVLLKLLMLQKRVSILACYCLHDTPSDLTGTGLAIWISRGDALYISILARLIDAG